MLYNINNNKTIVETVTIADSFFKRLKGLMGKKHLKQSEGLILISCNGIHTCFMRFPIDVIFLDMNYEVIKIKAHVKPWRIVNVVKNAYIVVELAEGTIENKGISLGDRLILK